jgi:hypothetical protein
VALLLAVSVSRAEDLAIMPATVPLTGAGARQQLLVVTQTAGRVVADHTAEAKYSSSNPAVATVDESGEVRAAGDGETIITATIRGQSARANVHVKQTKAAGAPSFRNDVIPILTRLGCNSGACHGALAGKGGLKLSLRGYNPDADHFVLTRQNLARRVDRQEPAQSLLLQKPARKQPHGGGKRFEDDSEEYQLIHDWIAAGATGPAADDARLTRIEVFPPAATLPPKAALRVVVRAWFSNGTAKDVTRWVRFGSSEDLVASVGDDGTVKVAGPGEAAVTVVFGTFVAVVPITVPFPNRIDAAEFARAPRHNVIDELILAKLESLKLPPSPPCDDRTFIRRAFLDAAGILPTPDEVERFANDKDPSKRSRLIDALLNRPEFVDYWTYKWSDLLLVSTRRLPQPAMWAFYRFVRRSVETNQPWDKFAREVLTASGSTLQNGAGNFFVLHKDISDLTESMSVTFLGMSMTCARCHNHPLEKWTQDQYWSLANLFARVTLKNGDRGGEVLVQAQPRGDVDHPRLGMPMPPAPLDGPALPFDDNRDRRADLADWLTKPDNPYFAKALVNRVWRNFMGRGLVEAEDDLRETNPPSNAPLFDALAKEFATKGYDIKSLIRQIMNSTAYQRSSVPRPESAADDRFYSRYFVRRLSAEVLLDAFSQVTAVPTPFNKVYTGVEGGTAAIDAFPLGTRALQLPDSRVASAFLDGFGRPDRIQTCSCERQQDTSVTQALHLNNGETINDKLRSKDSVLSRWLAEKVSDDEIIARLFARALSRPATPGELAKARQHLVESSKDEKSRREALEDLFWAVLTCREFVFGH